MSSTTGDSHSPSDGSTVSLHGEKEESGDPDNKNVQEGQNNSSALQNSTTLPETNLLGLVNETAVNGGGIDTQAGGTAKADLQVSPNRSGVVEENRYGMIYNLSPDFSILNVNGRSRFELVTVRENGRLRMFMVPKRWPQLVRSPNRDGRLKMWLLNDDQCDGGKASLPPVRRSI